ncbi:adenylosuccinate lyase [Flaviflexus salsibiostraticola]|uniref:Adenylosuccinate lyase n=1 Tax=Flaviflexus salsibiostraticola TaxID=1282737 RepID=A0A3S8Z9P9_9ACTO|nr:adenylosuccinate lyase [Flaviflexus salsibiostraticola]AZN30228.1 adenylosuccinate lyase [Flaviflexus salsibiostraticola]
MSTLSPLDGRYASAVSPLVDHLSEDALNRARVTVEVEWLIYLVDAGILPGEFSPEEREEMRGIVVDAAELAEIEAETRHDVKAVEYYLRRRVKYPDIVHIFCTSEDINNLAYALTIRDAVHTVWLPAAKRLVGAIEELAYEHRDQPMLSRTHGQTATPTTLGKEMAVFAWRLTRQLERIAKTEYLGKINGATGTYGAHVAALPEVDWITHSRLFVESLGLTWNPLTTQIESHDWQAELYSDIARFNRILHNFATDVWTYISLDYFHQNLAAQGSTGSSTMPHKVNPIRFENAEANLEISCALLDVLAATLVTSRMQRDLTDSSTQRNIGVAFGHSLLAIDNVTRGLAGLEVGTEALARDLDNAWEVLGEPIQQAMRAAAINGATGMDNPYERLKDLTRGQKVTEEMMRDFISSLGIPAEIEARLLELTPAGYTGLASKLVDHLGE